MELNICHLYPDILNLYGDRGNILCMRRRLEWRGIDAEVTEVTVGEQADFTQFDLFFIGGGQDFERLTAMEGVLSDIYVSGVRADDMALRFLYAGFPKERIHVQKDYGQLMEEATSRKLPVFVMPTYTAMLALRGTIAKRYGYKEFWQ